MRREWLAAAAVLVPLGLVATGCQKKTTPPVNTGPEQTRPIGELGPTDNATPPEAQTPTDVAPLPPAGGAPTLGAGRTYVVQKGEGLMAIARKFYNGDASQYRKIAAANNLQPPYNIKAGQKLVIP